MTTTGSMQSRLADMVGALSGARVLVVGDTMLDHYLVGTVNRISPEAPVPVLKVSSEHLMLGGAGNVATNILRLGGNPYLVSVSGDDDNAQNLDALIRHERVEATIIRAEDRPTTIKTRMLAQNQQMLRVDKEFEGSVDSAALDLLMETLEEVLPQHEVVVISDYGKGVINAAFLERFRALCAAQAKPPKVLVDPKIKNFALYQNAFCITPNTSEARQASGMHEFGSRHDILLGGLAIFKKCKCEHLLITLGPNGMALFESPGEVLHIPTVARRVYDVTGAGDTVIAVLATALAAGLPFKDSAVLANYAAGVVVGEVGAAACSQEELQRAILRLPEPHISPWLSEEKG
ncbi:D-glycero-beta-D-manno-heptose-7-phosphate kinase [Megalodesulfovibrio paquesii]